jgi:hypothetical protein
MFSFLSVTMVECTFTVELEPRPGLRFGLRGFRFTNRSSDLCLPGSQYKALRGIFRELEAQIENETYYPGSCNNAVSLN